MSRKLIEYIHVAGGRPIPVLRKPRDQFGHAFMAAVGSEADANHALEKAAEYAKVTLAANEERVQDNYDQLWRDSYNLATSEAVRNRPPSYADAVLTGLTSGLREPNEDPAKAVTGDAVAYKLQGVESDLMKMKKKFAAKAEYGEGLADGTLFLWRQIKEFNNPHAVYDLNKPTAKPLAEAKTVLELGEKVPDTVHFRKLKATTLTMPKKKKGVPWPLADPEIIGKDPFIYNHDAGWLKINRAEFMKVRQPAELAELTKVDNIPRTLETLVGTDVTKKYKQANRSKVSVKSRGQVVADVLGHMPNQEQPRIAVPKRPVPILDQMIAFELAEKKAAAERAEAAEAADDVLRWVDDLPDPEPMEPPVEPEPVRHARKPVVEFLPTPPPKGKKSLRQQIADKPDFKPIEVVDPKPGEIPRVDLADLTPKKNLPASPSKLAITQSKKAKQSRNKTK